MTAPDDDKSSTSSVLLVAIPFEVKHANEYRISGEFLEETVEEFNTTDMTLVEVINCEKNNNCEEEEKVSEQFNNDVLLWKHEIRYEYSSEDECEEFTQQVGPK